MQRGGGGGRRTLFLPFVPVTRYTLHGAISNSPVEVFFWTETRSCSGGGGGGGGVWGRCERRVYKC